MSLSDLIYEALGDAPSDHIVTVTAAREVADHLAAALIAKSGGPDHIVSIEGGKYTIQHPLGERFAGELFSCEMTTRVGWEMSDIADEDGRYRVWSDSDGDLRFEAIEPNQD